MKLEQQVCSLELAKRLKELGVRQENYFYWWVDRYGVGTDNNAHVQDHEPTNPKEGWRVVSAFSVAELGEVLPKGMPGNGHIEGTALHVGRKYEGDWFCGYSVHDISRGSEYPHTEWLHCETADTEADARAKMLIYLLENNLLTV